MTSKEAYEQFKEQFISIPSDEIKTPKHSIDDTVAEYTRLGKRAVLDREALIAKGLDPNLIDTLEDKTAAFGWAETNVVARIEKEKGAQEVWKTNSPEGFRLQRILAHDFAFAYRNEPGLKARVDKIRDGNGKADMVRDLQEYGVFGQEHPTYLQAINFDMTLLDRAIELSDILRPLLADSEQPIESSEKLIYIRNQAFTLAKEAYDTIREYGKFVFWEDPVKAGEYTDKIRY